MLLPMIRQGVSRRRDQKGERTSAVPETRPANLEAGQSNPRVQLLSQLRHDTTLKIVDAIGETRMRELRARGEAMDRDQAKTYARSQIRQYLAVDGADQSPG
jgi:hypothetical protein